MQVSRPRGVIKEVWSSPSRIEEWKTCLFLKFDFLQVGTFFMDDIQSKTFPPLTGFYDSTSTLQMPKYHNLSIG